MTVADNESGGGCRFCGGDHPADEGKTFLGLPLQTCPNMPKSWVMVDDVIVIVDENDDGSFTVRED